MSKICELVECQVAYSLKDVHTWSDDACLRFRLEGQNNCPHQVAGLMHSAEAVTQHVFGVEALGVLQLLRKMALGRIVAKHMPHSIPYALAAFDQSILQVEETLELGIGVFTLNCRLPYKPARVSDGQGQIGDRGTYRRAAK